MKYIAKDTHIRHDNVTYGPGTVIELAEKEALPMAHHLELMADTEVPDEDSEEAEVKSRRRR